MVLTAHQPAYLPWCGLLSKISRADLFCSFDAVQISRGDWTTRNVIKTSNGPLTLTVPVEHAEKRICDVQIARGNWARKHMRAIELAYRKAEHFDQHFAGVGAILDMYAEGGLLAEMNVDLLRYFLRALGLQVPIVNAADHQFSGTKSGLVLDMCRQLSATEYLFGGEGENYADKEAFDLAGVKPTFLTYECRPYPQLHGEFVPNLSAIDLLMNVGPKAKEYL